MCFFDSPEVTLWQELPVVRDSGILERLSPEELQRQEVRGGAKGRREGRAGGGGREGEEGRERRRVGMGGRGEERRGGGG